MSVRYAIFFAPIKGSFLESFGREWLGRCSETGLAVMHPVLSSINQSEMSDLVTTPRQYGFHGTLVPPFVLKEPCSEDELVAHAKNFAQGQLPFFLAGLSVREIGSFLALVVENQSRIARLAEASLRSFHPFRKQPTLAEFEQRRSRGLTPVQRRLLMNWWYPYVLEEYRFHMTLTGSIRDKKKRRRILKILSERTELICKTTHPVRELCIFHQAGTESPFTIIHRIPFGI